MARKAERTARTAPDDLDEDGLKMWRELESEIRGKQWNLLGNLCRNHGSLLSVRRAKAAAVKSGTFEAMVTAKNGALVVNPYTRAETRLITLENRMLLALGVGFDDMWG